MNYKNVEEVQAKRMALLKQITDISLTMSPADDIADWDKKKAVQDDLYKQLDALPSLEEAGQVPAKIGRPPVIKNGVKRQVAVTLPSEDWDQIDQAITSGEVRTVAEYFRNLHEQVTK